MLEYILRRLLYMLITIFAVASILFVIFRLMPGEATLQVISPAMDDAVQQRMKVAFGLDKPLWQQYFIYLENLVSLEWGAFICFCQNSYKYLGLSLLEYFTAHGDWHVHDTGIGD